MIALHSGQVTAGACLQNRRGRRKHKVVKVYGSNNPTLLRRAGANGRSGTRRGGLVDPEPCF